MALGVLLTYVGGVWWLLGVVFLMGAQSALFGPAKLGSIPEIVKSKHISAANGLIGLTTVLATSIGLVVGNLLSDVTDQGESNLWIAALVLIGTAIVGWFASLLIQPLPASNQGESSFPWNPGTAIKQTWGSLKVLAENQAILRVALGTAFFWALAGLFQMNLDQFAIESGTISQSDATPLLIALVLGVAGGCALAGLWSQGHVELGILPLGAAGLAICSMLLFFVQESIMTPELAKNSGYYWSIGFLLLLGISAGLFEVPLASFLQHRAPPEKRGTILAASNFMTFGGLLVIALVFNGIRMQVFDGSLDNITQIQSYEYSPNFLTQLESKKSSYQKQVESGEFDPIMADGLKSLSENLNEEKRVIAELLWIEYRHHFALEIPVDRSDQIELRFPDHQQLVASVFQQASGLPLMTSRQIFLICGLITIPIFVYIVYVIPQASVRFIVWLASETCYKIRVVNRENLPERGGALLVSNHVSWLDGALILLTSSRPVRIIVWGGNFESSWFRRFAELHGAIMINRGPKGIMKALVEGRKAIENGELVCIFAEGGITRTGQIQGFKPGLMRIVKGTDAPIVPIYLDELWGSMFSFSSGHFFWKWPRGWRTPISIHFGKPIQPPYNVHKIRQAVQQLGATAVESRKQRNVPPPMSFIRSCKQRKFKSKVADSTGVDLSGAKLLARTLVVQRLLNRHVLASKEEEQYVGVLLPPAVGACVVNAALSIDKRIAVNLNYTVSSDIMNQCIAQCGIKNVLTSRKFMERFEFQLDANIIYLEDLKDKPTLGDKLWGGFAAYLMPCSLLQRSLRLNEIDPDDVLTVIFTSGSTGIPKGVMLTHTNVSSNVQAVDQMIHLSSSDVLIGILPFFHSLGYTITLWSMLELDIKAAYHFSPLDAKIIGKLTEKHQGTLLLSTPTFLRGFVKRVDPENFKTLDVVVGGAEKLTTELCEIFEERFGVRPVEGYGATELSPLVSVNIPPARSIENFQTDCKEGTVGRTIPAVVARIVHPETGVELGVNEPGMLQVRGPNVMRGYLNMPEKTAEVIQDGWYVTGDIAMIDEEGFIKITGRQSRFSKIGGEMVPHIQIEETLTAIIGAEEEDGLKAAVTAVPDARKGERLIVLHTKLDKSAAELRQALIDAGLPNLYIPSEDSFLEIPEMPILGTGKLDLKGLKDTALQNYAEEK